jgi:AraC-like DNA-binding protein
LLLPFQRINYSSPHLRPPIEIHSIIENLLQKILIQSNSQEYGADLLINAYITEILIHITKIKLYQQPDYLEKDIGGNKILFYVLNYISEHIHEKISIDDISKELYISNSHLSRVFSKYMGISIHQYITKKKLYFAKQDLLSDTPIEQICSFYNFGDYTSFFRAFKKEFGISPKAYSKK